MTNGNDWLTLGKNNLNRCNGFVLSSSSNTVVRKWVPSLCCFLFHYAFFAGCADNRFPKPIFSKVGVPGLSRLSRIKTDCLGLCQDFSYFCYLRSCRALSTTKFLTLSLVTFPPAVSAVKANDVISFILFCAKTKLFYRIPTNKMHFRNIFT